MTTHPSIAAGTRNRSATKRRDMVFLSHANPEDNNFTFWLALQLAREGYPVWCDLTELLGGEDFWSDAELAIRDRAVKLIYVLSRTSNDKEGPLQELQLAKNVARDERLRDFIIPALIDDLPHRRSNIQLARINAIPFAASWAQGLQTLLAKLEKDRVPKSPRFSPSTVATWWRSRFSADQGVQNEPEDYLTNWFPIRSLPGRFYLHGLKRAGIGRLDISADLPYPAFTHNRFLVSFAPAEDFAAHLAPPLSIEDTYVVPISGPETPIPALRSLDRRQTRNFVIRLLNLAWDQMIRERRLPTYELSGGTRCVYFTRGLARNDSITFVGVLGQRTYRKVVGKRLNAHWHFAIQAKPLVHPTPVYLVKPHVLFSDDGSRIWESKRRLHRARRTHCRNWWNPEWRDRILATMTWLSNGAGSLEIPLARDLAIEVLASPLTFTSPVSYKDPDKELPPLFDRVVDDIEDDDLDAAAYEDER